MAHASPCDQCNQTGLPILFTRYAAAYSATAAGTDELDRLKKIPHESEQETMSKLADALAEIE